MASFHSSELEHLYKTEADPDVKERLLLVLKVEGDEMIPSRIAKELHRSRTWASDWLARYKKEGVEGLKDRHKSGRPSKLPLEIVVKIKRKLKESKQGWTTTKQVNETIVKYGRVRYYHHIYIYTLLHKGGFKQKVHVNTASEEEKEGFKKERRKY
jgi:putative transposase